MMINPTGARSMILYFARFAKARELGSSDWSVNDN
jgi:hypothetical protein